MKCLFTVLIFLLFAFDSFAQQFYITDRSDIVRITLLSDGSYKSETLKHTGNPDFISIALYKIPFILMIITLSIKRQLSKIPLLT